MTASDMEISNQPLIKNRANNSFNNSIQKINSHPGERQPFRTTRLNATTSTLSTASDDPDLIPLQTSTKNLQLGKLIIAYYYTVL